MIPTILNIILGGIQGIEVEFFVEDVSAKLLDRAANVRLVLSVDTLGRFKLISARPGPLGVGCTLERVPRWATAVSCQGERPPEILSSELTYIIVASTTGCTCLDLCLSCRAWILIVRLATLPVDNLDGVCTLSGGLGGERLSICLAIAAGGSVNLTDESTFLCLGRSSWLDGVWRVSRALSSKMRRLIWGAWELILARVLSKFRRSSWALHAAHAYLPISGKALVSDKS